MLSPSKGCNQGNNSERCESEKEAANGESVRETRWHSGGISTKWTAQTKLGQVLLHKNSWCHELGKMIKTFLCTEYSSHLPVCVMLDHTSMWLATLWDTDEKLSSSKLIVNCSNKPDGWQVRLCNDSENIPVFTMCCHNVLCLVVCSLCLPIHQRHPGDSSIEVKKSLTQVSPYIVPVIHQVKCELW